MGKQLKSKSTPIGQPSLERSAVAARTWMVDKALPFWAKTAVDDAGGFCEELSRHAQPNWQAVRRMRVQARQIYTYCLAHERGWYNGLEPANRTMTFMLRQGFMPDGEPGFISLLNPDLSIRDARRDLYDHAFYLLALAWHARVSTQRTSLALADCVLHFLDTHLSAPDGGFLEGLPEGDPRNALRRQNPHMHLFEAFLTLYDIGGDVKYLRRADDIFALFQQHFFDENTVTITEYFHSDWRPAHGKKGQSVEPGHMAEWIWLLSQYQARSGVDTRPWIDQIYRQLSRLDARLLPDEMDKSGRVLRSTQRLWVQTEMVKAHLALSEMAATDRQRQTASRRAAIGIDLLMEKYLRPNGTWIDVLGENGLPVLGAVPTSTFYHISCMISEACRVAGFHNLEQNKVKAHG